MCVVDVVVGGTETRQSANVMFRRAVTGLTPHNGRYEGVEKKPFSAQAVSGSDAGVGL